MSRPRELPTERKTIIESLALWRCARVLLFLLFSGAGVAARNGADFTSDYYAASFNRSAPAFTWLSADSLGRTCWGYEGFLTDNDYALLAVFDREAALARKSGGP